MQTGPADDTGRTEGAPGVYDPEVALGNVGGDHEVLAAVLEILREQGPSRLDAMERAVEAGEAAALESAAHALKGSASMLGMPTLSRLSLEVETLGADGRMDEAAALLPRLRAALERVLEAIGPGE